jgi:uncharacterized membrane protein
VEREQLTYKRTTYVQVLLVKEWKENNLRKGIAGESGKRTTYVNVLLVKQWKESKLRKSIAGKTVEREQPT